MNLKTLKHPLIFGSILLFLAHQIIEKVFNYSVPILHAYLDDLLCIPIVLGIGTQIIQWIHPIKDFYYLDKNVVITTTLFFTILFEAILPLINLELYTADWIDILMYGIGGTLFYHLISKKVKTEYIIFLQGLEND
ncbi:hypothetical protein SAMN05661096_02260 [Marivirga sericea]|uniref:Magnesium citrate secondary transporter n=1 Tax=Marivirga sericea TaxID=1028 RepID=A0A1X7K205_9BACT|nr:hypothetical protein [Marivirga sericea]SMG34824.1 hypothetical protein SAMN05661096_02260 [Marivirga sericea]